MSLTFSEKFRGAVDALTRRYDHRIDTELGRWQGRVFAALPDHGVLRLYWRNEGVIAPGLFRSNHPNAAALAQWQARGVRDVISLRPEMGPVHGFEVEACEALGLRLRNVAMAARAAPERAALISLLDIFETLKDPALIHCKSGADRTGLAAAMWHLHMEGKPLAEARRGLSLRHLHVKWSKTGVLDRVLDAYGKRLEEGEISLRDWVTAEYDPAKI